MVLKLLFVGKTDFRYNRDLILINGLQKRDDVSVDLFSIKKRNWQTFKDIKNLSKGVDFVVVPSFRHKDIMFIKLASQAPVVFDPLISKYMTRVLDYQVKWKGPHKYIVDWLAFYWPDMLIWDTKSHQEYLVDKYKITKPNKAIYIGADRSLFYPIVKPQKEKIIVGFYGSFNPLQGIDKIVKTAHLLKNQSKVIFRIIGSGSTYKEVTELAKSLDITNIEFINNVPYDKLNDAINEFDICLGIFGESVKADVVIPNKIYHYAAAKKCIITKDTKGVKEIFADEINIKLVANNPDDMAKAILELSSDVSKSKLLAEGAYHLIIDGYNEDKVANSFVHFLNQNH